MGELDGYSDIIDKAKEILWTDVEIQGSEFTLCYSDGTRWPKADFEAEHKTLSEIKDLWKKTCFVGRRCAGKSLIIK